jgi:telomerase reverse transcriptase
MSEEQSQLHTQMSFGAFNISVDSSGNSIQPLGLTQAEANAKAKPRFAEFCCNNIEVSSFHSINRGVSSYFLRSTVTWHW